MTVPARLPDISGGCIEVLVIVQVSVSPASSTTPLQLLNSERNPTWNRSTILYVPGASSREFSPSASNGVTGPPFTKNANWSAVEALSTITFRTMSVPVSGVGHEPSLKTPPFALKSVVLLVRILEQLEEKIYMP